MASRTWCGPLIGYRVGALDLMRTDARMICVVGPVHLGSPGKIADTVRALAVAGGPSNRMGLIPSRETSRWQFDPDQFFTGVARLPDCDYGDLASLLTGYARTARSSDPLSIGVAGEFLIVDLCHGLGDGRMITMLNQALVEGVTPDAVPAWFSSREYRQPLRRAAARWFSRDPRRSVQLVRSVAGRDAATVAAPAAAPVDRPWQPMPTTVFARAGTPTLDRIRAWRKANAGDVSVSALLIAAVVSAIGKAGIDVDPKVNVIFDCRRYLPVQAQVSGNFVTGVDLSLVDPTDPTEINAEIVRAGATGRPLAAMSLASRSFRRAWTAGTAYDVVGQVSTRPRAKLVLSNLGQVLSGPAIPWSAPPGRRIYNNISVSKDPEAIVVTVFRMGNQMDVSASFHENVFDRAAVHDALKDAVADPVDAIGKGNQLR